MDLTAYISFDVQIDLTGLPLLVLTNTSALPGGVTAGYWYEVTQPDGITLQFYARDVDVAGVAGINLRVDKNQKVQKGTYGITLFAMNDSDVSTFFRQFDFEYNQVDLNLIQVFDTYTPQLLYKDQTVFDIPYYSVISSLIAWTAAIGEGGSIANLAASTSVFDLIVGGYYYSAKYHLTYERDLTYQHQVYAWLSVKDKYTQDIPAFNVYNTLTILQMVDVLNCMHDDVLALPTNSAAHEYGLNNYMYACSLMEHLITSVEQNQFIDLGNIFNQFVNVAGECLEVLQVTNEPIAPFAAPALNQARTTLTYDFDVVDAQIASFAYGALIGATIVSISVDGIGRKWSIGLDTDVPAEGRFIFVPALGKFNYGGELMQNQWILVKYQSQ